MMIIVLKFETCMKDIKKVMNVKPLFWNLERLKLRDNKKRYFFSYPALTSLTENRVIQRTSLKDRFKSSAAISRETTSMNISTPSENCMWVTRTTSKIGFFVRNPQNKLLVSAKNNIMEIRVCRQTCYLVP